MKLKKKNRNPLVILLVALLGVGAVFGLVSVVKDNGESSEETPAVFERISLDDEEHFTLDSGKSYSPSGTLGAQTGYNSYTYEVTKKCEFYIECNLPAIHYVIVRADGTATRYQVANGTYIQGIENTFTLEVGDKVGISIQDTASPSSVAAYFKILK